ncbi:GspE/PulE family protein [Candidatus Parcubacteria bacterium]|nr:GspE/PulE family protein [Candidatus Parcubacteria bacterium]
MLDHKKLKTVLIKNKLITEVEYKKYVKQAKEKKVDILKFLIEEKITAEQTIYEAIAKNLRLPFIDLKNETIRKDILNIIPEPIAVSHQIIAFDKDEKKIKIATLDPEDLQTFDFIKKKINMDLDIYITTPESIIEILKQYHKGLEAEFQDIEKKQQEVQKEKEKDTNGKKLKELAQDLPIIRIVDTFLEYAIFENASDIHIEPLEKEVTVRYRVDGVLRKVMTLPKKTLPGIVARIKILSNLKLDEHRLPQDGRFKIQTDDYKISFHVSIITVFDGEKVVMRLLNESSRILSLEELGLQEEVFKIVKRNIAKPNGMILVTGPTGSGKTTTLYTILNMLNQPGTNITTIEDPIEYRLQGINQSQINAKIGYTFASGLRSFLRQDPDIIMVGEIRDNETADIAVNAAMTGHLVLSTLHTNDAATTLPRLDDMKIEPFLIASTVNIIVAQRLVRKICKQCIMSYKIDKSMEQELEKHFNVPDLINAMAQHGAVKSNKEKLSSMLFYKGKGCKHCGNSGYKGRIGIYEALEVDEQMAGLILKRASSEEINKAAKAKGMISLLQDGFMKVKQGITTIEEILRVTKE